jgi:hypothetical protein
MGFYKIEVLIGLDKSIGCILLSEIQKQHFQTAMITIVFRQNKKLCVQ